MLNDYDENELIQMIGDGCLFKCIDKYEDIIGTSGWKNEHIRHMYIIPEWMGQGIGKYLLQHAEQDYKRRTKKIHINAGVILYARGFLRRMVLLS